MSAGAGTAVGAGPEPLAAYAGGAEEEPPDGSAALLAGALEDAAAAGSEAGPLESAPVAGAAADEDAAGAAAGSGAAGASGAEAPQAISRLASRMNIPVRLSLGQRMVMGKPPSVTVSRQFWILRGANGQAYGGPVSPSFQTVCYSRLGATSRPSSFIDSRTW